MNPIKERKLHPAPCGCALWSNFQWTAALLAGMPLCVTFLFAYCNTPCHLEFECHSFA